MQLTNHQRAALHLAMAKGFGPGAFAALSRLGGPAGMLEADEHVVTELLKSEVRRAAWFSARNAYRANRDEIFQGAIDLMARGASLWVRGDEDYPRGLHDVDDAPFVKMVSGARLKEALAAPCVGIVGTREPSEYGARIAEKLARDLAKQRVTVVSGAAIGIDSIAHRGAMDAGGLTVAVLGEQLGVGGGNVALRKRVVEAGGVVTEMLPGVDMHTGSFPQRNRIVTALSSVVVVVEGKAGSGTKYSARFAREQKRVLMAVPGNIDERTSVMPNQMIKDGALPVTSVDDILAALGIKAEPAKRVEHHDPSPEDKVPVEPLPPTLAALLGAISGHGEHLSDDVAARAGVDAADAASGLIELELLGLIKRGHGGLVARVR